MSFTVQSTWFYVGLISGVNLAGIPATKGCPILETSGGWDRSTFPGAVGNFSVQEVIEMRNSELGTS